VRGDGSIHCLQSHEQLAQFFHRRAQRPRDRDMEKS
jgi:hypothetical protein